MSTESEFGHPCRLYAISPPNFELRDFAAQLQNAISGGDIGSFQLRMKDATDDEIKQAAEHLIPICRDNDIAFILNDRPDIALDICADGVHLGQADLEEWPIKGIRKQSRDDLIIGVSCHDSSHMAMDAGEAGADYVAFGAFHPTKSKSAEKLAQYGTPTSETLTWWYNYTVLPCVAIGGMTPQNCIEAVSSGADFIAAITAIWEHPESPAKAVQEFNSAIRKGVKSRKNLVIE